MLNQQDFSSTEDNELSVSEFTAIVKTMLEGSLKNIHIKGEISNFRPNSSGHIYFQLKDNFALLSAVMFRGRASSLTFKPKDGDLVTVWGSVSVYEPQGKYQLVVTKMLPAGNGAIMEMIEERKKRFIKEGLFDSSKKKALPKFPETIGVVTSPTGAAVRDILQISRRRNSKVNVIVFPALVQGSEAAQSISSMIKLADRLKICDVLIVGRGGGSIEDLLPFSEESVVRAVAESEIPVISAVGHEFDVSLCDYAADIRASTPSAAAEIAVPQEHEIREHISNLKSELYRKVLDSINSIRLTLKQFTPEGLELSFRNIELRQLNRFESAKKELNDAILERLDLTRRAIKEYSLTLEHCNPQTIFDRGYSMVTDSNGNVVRNAGSLNKGDQILIRPAKGKIKATVGETDE